jgi:hypothetical protein
LRGLQTGQCLGAPLSVEGLEKCAGSSWHAPWQLIDNDGTGAPTLTDMGVNFGIATDGVLTLYIAASPNGSSVWVQG